MDLPASLFDPRFTFEEERHLYQFDGQPLQSATGWLKQFKRPFDSDHWARKKAAELGLTPRQVRKMWDEKRDRSSELGTKVHKAIELTLLGRDTPPLEPEVAERYGLFHRLWTGRLSGARAAASELRTYSLLHKLAGTMDLLVEFKRKLYIGDWKTNEKFTSGEEGYGYLLPPFDKLRENKLNEYAIQVSLYRVLLAEHGLEVDGGFIAHLGPGMKEAGVYFTPDLRPLVLRALNGEEPLW